MLVIDDLHELKSADALRWLELFLARLPAQLRAVLATREDPGLGLHRLRLTGALTEVRGPDLRFSQEETRQLLEAAGIVLSGRSGPACTSAPKAGRPACAWPRSRSPGTPTPSVSLPSSPVANAPSPATCWPRCSDASRQRSASCCCAPSILERVSGPLADALTGGAGSEAILQSLEDANAFVISLDVGRSWFRYHHLFADLLQLELRRTSPEIIDELHRAAAQWLEQHGYPVEAIRHAQAAGEWAHATRLLADNCVDLVFDGRKATLRALLAAFPAGAPEGDAELALACATARLYDGLLDESRDEHRRRRAAGRDRGGRPATAVRAAAGAARGCGWRASAAISPPRSRRCGPSEARTAAGTLARSDDHRASALMNLGIAELWSLHVDDARRDLEEALALARRIGRPYLEIGCLGHLALAAAFSGSPIPVGLRLSEEAVTIAEAHGWGSHRIVTPAVAAGAAALAWLGRIAEAEQWLDRVEPAQPPAEELEIEPVLHYARAFVRLGQGRFEEALAEFRAAERTPPSLAREHALPVELRGWIVQTQVLIGDTAAARAALADLDAEERDGAGMRVAAAALELAEGRPQDAVDVLAPMIVDAPEAVVGGSPQVLNLRRATVHALLLDAVARDQLGDRRAAEASIERALELAELDGMILQFMLVPVRELLERHPRHRTAHATLLATILDVLAGTAPQPRARADAPAGRAQRGRAARPQIPARATSRRPRSPPSCSSPRTR